MQSVHCDRVLKCFVFSLLATIWTTLGRLDLTFASVVVSIFKAHTKATYSNGRACDVCNWTASTHSLASRKNWYMIVR